MRINFNHVEVDLLYEQGTNYRSAYYLRNAVGTLYVLLINSSSPVHNSPPNLVKELLLL